MFIVWNSIGLHFRIDAVVSAAVYPTVNNAYRYISHGCPCVSRASFGDDLSFYLLDVLFVASTVSAVHKAAASHLL